MFWKSDSNWVEAFSAVMQLSDQHKNIVVPVEFLPERDTFLPETEAKYFPENEITAFAIPKDHAENLPYNLVKEPTFSKFHCVFANAVFVVFSALEQDPIAPEDQIQQHTPFFFEKRKEYLVAEQGETNAGLPYLLDTQKNRILKKLFPNKHYVTELFRDLSHEPQCLQQEVFQYCVTQVSLELSGYCNRNCEYGPVSQIEERKNKERKMDRDILEKCVSDLAEINYCGAITFFLFNEPLYDREYLLECLHYVRKQLPEAYIKITTNGDYLTPDYFEAIAAHGANELGISVHYSGIWNREKQLERIYEILDRIGIGEKGILEETATRLIFHVDTQAFPSETMQSVMLRSEDFSIHGIDRGGSLTEGIRRTSNLDHCNFAVEQFNIAFDGTILPCCSICSDSDGTAAWTYGNVRDYSSLYSAYTSQKPAKFRSRMFAPRKEDEYTPDPCKTCAIAYSDGLEDLYRSEDHFRREIYDCWLKESK